MARKPVWIFLAAAAALAACATLAPAVHAKFLFPALTSRSSEPALAVRDGTRREPLSSAALVNSLSARGYRNISQPRRKGDLYVVEARSQRGEHLTLVVDARTGEISGLRRRPD